MNSLSSSEPVALDRLDTTECTILVFSILAEHLGAREIVQSLPLPMTAAKLLDLLSDRITVIGRFRAVIRVAVNREYVDETALIRAGDEVALITPTSGG